MAVISKIFCMRRGLRSTMTSSKANTVLSSGENFLEIQGSTVGKSKVKMKMGDGSTAYKDLPYVLGDTSTDPISFNENTSTNATTALGAVTTGATLDNIVAGLKKAVSLNTQSLTELNDDEINLNNKLSNYYTSTEVDNKLKNIDLSNYYTKTDIDNKLKNINLSSYYTKAEVDSKITKVKTETSSFFGAGDKVGDIGRIADGTYNASWIIYAISGNTYQLFSMRNITYHQMNSSETNDGGYTGSEMYKFIHNTVLPNLKRSGLNITACDLVSKSVYNSIRSNVGMPNIFIDGDGGFWLSDPYDYYGSSSSHYGFSWTNSVGEIEDYAISNINLGVRPSITVVR